MQQELAPSQRRLVLQHNSKVDFIESWFAEFWAALHLGFQNFWINFGEVCLRSNGGPEWAQQKYQRFFGRSARFLLGISIVFNRLDYSKQLCNDASGIATLNSKFCFNSPPFPGPWSSGKSTRYKYFQNQRWTHLSLSSEAERRDVIMPHNNV